MTQTFTVPSSTVPSTTSTLRMDWNYVSEELSEWAGSTRPFNDPFKIYIAKQGQATSETPCVQPLSTDFTSCLVKQVTVDDAAALPTTTFIGDCQFNTVQGDNTCSQTGWQTATVDLRNFAGTNQKLVLTFKLQNAGDALYETKVLVDKLRFKTVWVDVKVLPNAVADAVRIGRDLLRTNDLLSQAGLIVQRRPTIQSVTLPTPNGLADSNIDVAHQLSAVAPQCIVANNILVGLDGLAFTNKILTGEEADLMGTQRSGTVTDVNVYYVNSATGVSGVSGWTANRGDFCSQVDLPAPLLGAMLTNLGTSKTMSHELSHALIEALSSGTLLHGAPSGTIANSTHVSPTIQPAQSTAIQQSPNLVD
jgi:hypothetical protein